MNYGNLGAVYALQGRFKDAARLYEKAVSAVSTNSIWWGNLADAYRWTPELSWKAPAVYRRAVQLGENELAGNARDSHLRSRVALYLAALGDKDSASREIAEALRLSPDDGYVLFEPAWYMNNCTRGTPRVTPFELRCAPVILRRKFEGNRFWRT